MTVLPRRYRRNAIANYVTSFVVLFLALATTPVLVRGLGQDAYGVWALATTWVLYFNLLQFGAGRATVKFVAEARALKDRPRVVGTIATSFFGLALPGTLLVLATPLLSWLFLSLFDIPEDLKTPALVLVSLTMIDMAFALPADTFGGTLAGYQRFDLLAVTVTGTAVAQAAAWTVIVVLGGGLIAIAIATITFSLASQVARFLMVRWLVTENPIRLRNFDRDLIRPLLSMSGWIAVLDVATVFLGQIDVVVVGAISGVAAAGIYAVGQKLATLAPRLTSPLTNVFFPHAAELAATGDRAELRRVLLTGTRIAVATAAPLTIALCLLAEPTIDAWVGDGYEDAALVVVFLSLAAFIAAASQLGGYVLRGMGVVKIPAFIGILEAVINITLSITLGFAIGLVGVALATLIARVIAQVIVGFTYTCHRTETPVSALAGAIARGNLLASLAALGVGFALLRFGIDAFHEVVGAGVVIVVTYAVVMLLVGLSAEERNGVLKLAGLRTERRA